MRPATIKALAHSLDITNLSDEAAKHLAPDVEYRLREIIQVRVQPGWPPSRDVAGAACVDAAAKLG